MRPYLGSVLTREMITSAYHRLLDDLGTSREKSAIERHEPFQLPSEATLMNRAIEQAAKDPAVGASHLRAALELAAQDQSLAEGREVNVITLLRNMGVSWREIAYHRGLESGQAARQRFERLTNRSAPPVSITDGNWQPGAYGPTTMRLMDLMVYAFRIADEKNADWYGDPELLPAGAYSVSRIDFAPGTPRPPFSGRSLEFRYGVVEADVLPGYLRAYPLIDGRRIAMTADAQLALFGG